MAEVKFTKNELRNQQIRLAQLNKYLPTLQLKKAMLQGEVAEAKNELRQVESVYQQIIEEIQTFSDLLSETLTFDFSETVKIKELKRRYDNIAGVEVPYFDSLSFEDFSYNLTDTPPWVDATIQKLRVLKEYEIRILIAKEKKIALEKEFREVSIRVNLFEKVLIPRAEANIKKIKIFLGDQQLSAVSQAKAAKNIIEENKRLKKEKLLCG